MFHSTKKLTNLTKIARSVFTDRKLKIKKTKTKCDATITTIIYLMLLLNFAMFLNLICKKR